MLRPIKSIPLINLVLQPVPEKMPVFSYADPTTLLVEGEYQRELSKASITLIRKIAAGFNWLHVKPPVCARSNGKLCVIDGQHTAIAAASRKIPKIPVMIVEAVEMETRAGAFVAHNTNRLNITPMQLFHSRAAAGDKSARLAKRVCSNAGINLLKAYRGNNDWEIGDSVAFRAIEKMANRRTFDEAVRALRVLVAAKRAPAQQHEIMAVEAILYDKEFGYDGPVFDLVTVIRSKTVDEWVLKSSNMTKIHARTWHNVATVWLKAVKRG